MRDHIQAQPAASLPRQRSFGRHVGLGLAVVALWAITLVLVSLVIRETGGRFVYPLDDAYIHMATAKHFAENLTWGVTPYAFSSSVSSIAWPLLISGVYRVLGSAEMVPLVLNGISATLLLCVVHFLLLSEGVRPLIGFLVLLAFLYFTPLPAMIISGQEHILHLLITILFITMCARTLAQKGLPSASGIPLLCILAALLTASRYEGLFLVCVATLLLVLRGLFLVSVLVGLSSLLPLSVYGLISAAHGWPFIPAPILLNGRMPAHPSLGAVILFLQNGITQFVSAGHVRFLVVAAVVLLTVRIVRERNADRGMWSEHTMMLLLFIGMTLQHVFFARMGAFYRYEAYIVGAGVLFLSLALSNLLLQSWPLETSKAIIAGVCVLVLLVIVNPVRLFSRASASVLYTPMACSNVFEQQYQMGLFLKTYYERESVAANDIGAINFLADLKCCDLAGLADLEVFRAIRNGTFGTGFISSVTQQEGVKIAILYRSWFTGKSSLPARWIPLGQWSLQENVAVGGDTVTFYAVESDQTDLLRKRLRAFAARLPRGVIQSGDYVH